MATAPSLVVEQDIGDFRRHWNSPELREGIEAFLDKREPRYWAGDAPAAL